MKNFIRKLIRALTAIRLETDRYKHSTLRIIINWLTAFLKDLFSAQEIRLYGLADPEDGANRIRQYVSKEMADRFYRKYNPGAAVPNIEDKFILPPYAYNIICLFLQLMVFSNKVLLKHLMKEFFRNQVDSGFYSRIRTWRIST